MGNNIPQHIGKKIRMYRKHKGMTLEELARIVYKSKASISKYEKGYVSIDISTLCEIARALQVAPSEFFNSIDVGGIRNKSENPFGETDILYLYHYHANTVYTSVMMIGENDERGHLSATMYYKIDTIDNLERCDCIYHGQMHAHDTVISIFMRNYHNPVENCLLNFTFPMRKASVLIGMISGLGSNTLLPTAYKILLSKEILTVDQSLISKLTIDPAVFKSIKGSNAFYIPLE